MISAQLNLIHLLRSVGFLLVSLQSPRECLESHTWAVRQSLKPSFLRQPTEQKLAACCPAFSPAREQRGVSRPVHLSWWDGQMQEFCMLVPNLGIYIPTQEELRLQGIRLATGQRWSGQHRGSFQIHPRAWQSPPKGQYRSDLYAHAHGTPLTPGLILQPSLNSYFKLLLMLFSQHEAETFY